MFCDTPGVVHLQAQRRGRRVDLTMPLDSAIGRQLVEILGDEQPLEAQLVEEEQIERRRDGTEKESQ